MGSFSIRELSAAEAAARCDELADILVDCVAGGASVSFMHPFGSAHARAFWEGVIGGVAAGERVLLVAEDDAGGLIGTAQLIVNLPPNQPHRADVAKMLVHRGARKRGVGAALLAGIDAAARARNRTLLVLDTVTGGDAERMYIRAGWQRVGVIPDYALFPDGRFCDTTVFYKRL